MGREQSEREPVHAEGDASGMRHLSGLGADAPDLAEMLAMAVEAHAGGRLLGGTDRNEQLELQGLFDLVDCHDLADPAEERIARLIDVIGQPQPIGELTRAHDPALAESVDGRGRADADILAHAEGLQAVQAPRRLMAETVAGHVEDQAARRNRATFGHHRIDRVAGGRAQHQVGRRQRLGPIAAGREPVNRRADLLLAAMQAAHAAEEVRKAFQIARFLELAAAHHRWKAQHLGAAFALARDQARQAFHDLLVERRAGIDAVRAHRAKQRVGDQIERIAPFGGSLECNVHLARLLRRLRAHSVLIETECAPAS